MMMTHGDLYRPVQMMNKFGWTSKVWLLLVRCSNNLEQRLATKLWSTTAFVGQKQLLQSLMILSPLESVEDTGVSC